MEENNRPAFAPEDQILAHVNENPTAGFSIPHPDSKFKNNLLQMSFKSSRKAIFQDIDLGCIARPSEMTNGTSQLESFIKPFSTLIPSIIEVSSTENCVLKIKILTGAIFGFIGEMVLGMEDKLPTVPLLGETLHVTYSNGVQAYFEQTKTVPSSCHFLLIDEKFKLHGKLEVG